MAKILVVEDQQEINDLIVMNLKNQGYDLEACVSGKEGLDHALDDSFDLIILDWGLPEIDGIQVCQTLRSKNCHTPILMLTARDNEVDRVLGLEMGADDYLAKPFSILELQARVKAQLRRSQNYNHSPAIEEDIQESNDNILCIGNLKIDSLGREVMIDDEKISLTAKEFDLLLYFANHPGRVFSRQQLLDAVWGYDQSNYEHTVNSHINRLRSKIETNVSDPLYILTVRGAGYKFNDRLPKP